MKLTLALVAALPALAGAAFGAELKSPDGRFQVTVAVRDGAPAYRVSWKGEALITDSRLGLELDKAPFGPLAVVGQKSTRHDETWAPAYGERSRVRDHYNQLTLDLRETAAPRRRLQLTFRAYDQGVALCYTLPKQPGLETVTIARERSEFRLPADWTAWATYSAQGAYAATPISKVRPGCERPLLIQAAPERFLAIAEAKLVDYSRMKLAPLAGDPHALVSDLGGPVTGPLPLTTPWRVVMAAGTPGRLLEQNDLLLNLNDPCAIADTSWIRPGKVIRDVTLSTAGAKECMDFCARNGLQYVLFDAGWYGPENSDTSDATGVRPGLRLDLQEVIRYGRERGVGVILYVNHKAAERQLDQILPLYHQWGVKGIKLGFVNVGSQQWTSWVAMAVRKAAENQLMVDVHDEYRPTGYARTYPNLMTVEGIAGDEVKDRSNAQTLTILFSRFLAGPADNTICYTNERVERLASHAYQLAKAVCLYSPLQHLFWYDRPAGLAGLPELEFFAHCPAAWDDTKVLQGEVGECAVMARRSGAQWFVGAMNAGRPRTFTVPLSFLAPGKKYVAHLYEDDPTVPTATHVRVTTQSVDAATVLHLAVSAQGGAAVWIAPVVPLKDVLQGPPPSEERVYKRAGKEPLKLYLFRPAGWKKSDRRTAAVWIHGGGWSAGSADAFFPHARYYALRGAVGVSIAYRLAKAGGPTVAECLTDCKSAIRYLRAHAAELGIDPQRIAVLGDSAGGHLAAALGTVEGFDDPADNRRVSAVPNAMVLYNPITDMTEGNWVRSVAPGKAPDAPILALARRLSPVFSVRPGQPPALLMHGLADQVVTPEQSRRFAAAMQAAGNRCDLALLDGARHAFVVTGYTAPAATVVNAIRTGDAFLASLGLLEGAPTLSEGVEEPRGR